MIHDKIKWNIFWLIKEVCLTWNFCFCFQLSVCLISWNLLKVWMVTLKWMNSLPLSTFLWHIQWVLIDKWGQGWPNIHGKPERQFLFTRSGYFRCRALWAKYEEWKYFYTKESFYKESLPHCWIICCIQNTDGKILMKGWHTPYFLVLNSWKMCIALFNGFKVCALIFFFLCYLMI